MVWYREFSRSLWPLLGGFSLLLLTGAAAVFLSFQQQEAASAVRHTLEVESQLNRIQTLITDAETGQRGYILTGRLTYLDPHQIARGVLGNELDRLASDIAGSPGETNEMTSLRKLVEDKMAELQQTIDLRTAGRLDGALAIVNNDSGKQAMTDIRQVISAMRGEEDRLLEARSTHAARLNDIGQVVLIGSILLVLAIGAFAIRDGSQRLRALRAANLGLEAEAIEREAAEGQVRQLQKMEAVGQLTGGVAHDFNNMLAIVIGSLDMARRRLTGAEHPSILRSLDNASDGANRAAVLTARLLAFSRQQPLEPVVLDINKLVAGMSDLLVRTISEPVQIETVLAGGLWRAHTDRAQLESALLNLAVNARDAMPNGGKLTIETGNAYLDDRYASQHTEVTAGQYVLISVSDSGVGMGPEVIERAFEPFYTTKGVGKGSGLGLSQVFGFVKQTGGHLKIYSEVGEGTTVKIYLPRHVGASVLAETISEEFTPQGEPDELILVVEDEASVRRMTVDALRDLGYTVVHAGSGGEALLALETHQSVALLFTDIVMPEMSGRELADRALKDRPDLKVLYTTGYTRNAVVHNGIVDPGTAFLQKPFTLQQLAAKVRQTIGG
jgi:signal transduction histidine kinase/CheY-like chemotaxis protein